MDMHTNKNPSNREPLNRQVYQRDSVFIQENLYSF